MVIYAKSSMSIRDRIAAAKRLAGVCDAPLASARSA